MPPKKSKDGLKIKALRCFEWVNKEKLFVKESSWLANTDLSSKFLTPKNYLIATR